RMLRHMQKPELAREHVALALEKEPGLAPARALLAELDGRADKGVQTVAHTEGPSAEPEPLPAPKAAPRPLRLPPPPMRRAHSPSPPRGGAAPPRPPLVLSREGNESGGGPRPPACALSSAAGAGWRLRLFALGGLLVLGLFLLGLLVVGFGLGHLLTLLGDDP